MKINYIITNLVEGDNTPETLTITQDSISAIIKKGDKIDVIEYEKGKEPEVLNTYLATINSSFTHICIIPNKSILTKDYRKLMESYMKDETSVYVPLVELLEQREGEAQFKSFLNTGIWKPYLNPEKGTLTNELALKQIDTVIYGSLIPVKVVADSKFKTNIKFFSYFEFFNRITNKEVEVKGVPKVLFTTEIDFELKSADMEEKKKFFKEAQTQYTSDLEIEIA